jgi:hypothetical protein
LERLHRTWSLDVRCALALSASSTITAAPTANSLFRKETA